METWYLIEYPFQNGGKNGLVNKYTLDLRFRGENSNTTVF